MIIEPGRLNRLITVERPVADPSIDGAGAGTWEPVAQVWAEVQDALPSRAERIDSGINLASRPARVRMYWRSDITADMRFAMGGRIMDIVSGPAEIGFREGLEFMVVDHSAAGGGA